MSASKILVVGGGIVGLTAATALAQKGFEVDLVERNPKLSDGGGWGIGIFANATRALNQIGVAEAFVEAGMPADSQVMHGADGTPAFELPLPRIGGPQWPARLGIRRSSLHQILADAAIAAGVQARCGTTVDDWEDGDRDVDVQFSDGTRDSYMLMVGADGISSATRTRLMPEVRPEFSNVVVWRAEVPRPGDLERMHVYVSGEQCVVGIVPLSDKAAYMYIGQSSADASHRDDATLHLQMQELLKGFGGLVAELAPMINRPDAVNCRPVYRMIVPAPWHRGRVVVIGDAAHVHSPALEQGAAMGIEDAIVLAEEVHDRPDDIANALDRFSARRYERVAAVVDGSTRLAGGASREELAEIRRDVLELLSQPI